jgi:hypothetical protein
LNTTKILQDRIRIAFAPAADPSVLVPPSAEELLDLDLAQRLAVIRGTIRGRVVFTTSFGIEDQAIAHAIFRQALTIDVVTLDTGRLFPQTYVCPSTRTFAVRFLQTSPRGDSPCVVANPSPPVIVAPAGVRSIAMMRACLVSSGLAADLGDVGVDRSRDAGLAVFRAVERVAAFGLVLGLVTGSSEVHAAPSAAPPQPRLGKTPGRARSRGEPQSPQVTTATLRSDKKASQF